MNLGKKKILAAKTLGVGLGRIIFNNERLAEIKEAEKIEVKGKNIAFGEKQETLEAEE